MANEIAAPETTNLVPMTYAEAMELYVANRRKPFSFLTAPYGIVKTITILNGNVVASPADAARAHYDWLMVNRRAR